MFFLCHISLDMLQYNVGCDLKGLKLQFFISGGRKRDIINKLWSLFIPVWHVITLRVEVWDWPPEPQLPWIYSTEALNHVYQSLQSRRPAIADFSSDMSTCVSQTLRNFSICFCVSGSSSWDTSFIQSSAPRYSVLDCSIRFTVSQVSEMAR